MATETCLCGTVVPFTETSLRKFREPCVIIGCKACKYTGTRKPEQLTLGAVVVGPKSAAR